MRGITQARLLEIMNEADPRFDEIMNNCTELTPWLPIADAPKDNRRVLVFIPGIGQMSTNAGHKTADELGATHYCELPDDPK